jgi:gamma-glutamyltranspeptidase / glutathione hydrolase
MRMLELGGNAFDAAVAAGFVLQVVQPHLNGAGGDMPALLWDASAGKPEVLCAQGVAPAAASPTAFTRLGLDAIPGTGPLAACVPGAIDGWLLMLRDRGSLALDEVLAPAIGYAERGYPVSAGLAGVIESVADLLVNSWPTSAAIYLPHGRTPQAGARLTNPDLATTYRLLLLEAKSGGGSREHRIDAARDVFYRGYIAEQVANFFAADLPASTGTGYRGLLTGQDLAGWSATWEQALTVDFHGVTVCKPGPWSQGPVLLQMLGILAHFDLRALDPHDPDYIHTLVEVTKLAFADREAWYGDPLFADVPLTALLSRAYSAERSRLVSDVASREQRPGNPDGRQPILTTQTARAITGGPGIGEPTVPGAGSHLAPPAAVTGNSDRPRSVHANDTCHVDVVDRFGNFVSATPSGGWLQSSPTVPGLGFALGTRMQMFDLDSDRPNVVQGGKRPRTTLSPGLALRDGAPWLAFGTPGGDQQDQWSLQFLLNVVLHGDDLQRAIDRPVFHSRHFPSSFYPRESICARLVMEDRFPEPTLAELARRSHDVQRVGPWSLTRVCAVGQLADGTLRAGANPRGMEGYAVGR